jgi:hypothetical protein
VIRHQAVAEQAERIAFLGSRQSVEEGDSVIVVSEDVGAIVASVQGVVDQAVVDRTR